MKALLLVSFGTSVNEARKKTIDCLVREAEEAFADYRVFLAFTSGMIIKKLRTRDGVKIDTVEEALEKIAAMGAEEVLVQPTHLINGYEIEKMSAVLLRFRDRFLSVKTGRPLLDRKGDRLQLISLLAGEMPRLKRDEAWVFMGHGTGHEVNAVYEEMNELFREEGYPHAYVGTVEGTPRIEEILCQIQERGYKKVYLAPLMFVAGDHALNDMAGDESDSWKNRLEGAGIEAECVLKGLGEYAGVRSMYLEHAGQAALRFGFTTGTCAAAAARAAGEALALGAAAMNSIRTARVLTPKGIRADIPVAEISEDHGTIRCSVQKDAGDDPDVTDGALITVSVRRGEPTDSEVRRAYIHKNPDGEMIFLYGGEGVGLVTKPGLACPVGKSAINPVPREMIFAYFLEGLRAGGWASSEAASLSVCVSVGGGEALAERTFNPRLGIEGGISILGTSGIVEPMSEDALTETIRLEARMKTAQGCQTLVMTPGNYGERFLTGELGISLRQAVRVSNFIGEGLKILNEEGAERILLVGHIGKLIKVAGGALNTHSRFGDRRMEILAECVEEAEGSGDSRTAALADKVRRCNTTEEAVGLLRSEEVRGGTFERAVFLRAVKRIQKVLEALPFSKAPVEVVTFSNVYGILAVTDGAEALITQMKKEQTE